MSTTFEVYTPTASIPTFNEVILLSKQYLSEFLTMHNIFEKYIMDVNLMKNKTNNRVDFSKSNPAIWQADEYAWFTVNDVPGGCDAYVDEVEPLNWAIWNDEFVSNGRAKKIEKQMRKCLEVGFNWRFRRSVGQPYIINLSYGLIAAAFATLVDGFIFSDDGAWDYAMFPTTADEFLQKYFNPHYIKSEDANWAKECIDGIKKIINERSNYGGMTDG